VGGKRDEVVAEIAGYGETDLVCYRVDRPEELRRGQDRLWLVSHEIQRTLAPGP